MAEQTTSAPKTGLLGRVKRGAGRLSRRRFRRLVSILYVVLAVVLTAGLLLFIGFVVYSTPPSWLDDPRSFVIEQRLSMAGATLAFGQLAAGWLLGLFSAVGGAMAASHQAALKPRLAVVRRRTNVLVAVVLLLRVLLLGIILLALAYLFTDWLGDPIYVSEASRWRRSVRNFPLLPALAAGLSLIHLFAGPFLRRRYSMRLGALAAAFKRRRSDRVWAAANLRLGAGLLGVMSALWGMAAAVLPLMMVVEPSYYTSVFPLSPLLPGLSSRTAEVLFISGSVIAGVIVYTTGQIVLPWLFRRIAERRLAKPPEPAGRQMPASVRRHEEPL